MLHALIMAGGAGTRFWPVSRSARPKQLLALVAERSLLQDTIDRLAGVVPRERILVATAAVLAPAVREQLPDVPPQAILAEPCKCDTAPCIGLAALLIAAGDRDATMLVLPSDHVIRDTQAFAAGVRQGLSLVDAGPSRLVTFGIRPTYPAEIFGYLERGEALPASVTAGSTAAPAYRVVRFREKPTEDIAREYIASGKFYWNSGIFLWRASTIIDALGAHQPAMLARLQTIAAAYGRSDFNEVFAREFAAIRGISIDFAVMEHATDVAMIEAPFDWDDLGSWQSLARQRGADDAGNTIVGRHLGLNTKGTIVFGAGDGSDASEHLIVTVGVEDLIIVHTPDATLVANRRDEESLREVVKRLQEQGWKLYL